MERIRGLAFGRGRRADAGEPCAAARTALSRTWRRNRRGCKGINMDGRKEINEEKEEKIDKRMKKKIRKNKRQIEKDN
jgi:hypothetical protein